MPYNKLLYKVDGKSIIEYTLDNFTQCRTQNAERRMSVILLCSEPDRPEFEKIISDRKKIPLYGGVPGISPKASADGGVVIITGGPTRAQSVINGLQYIKERYAPCGNDVVLICDGARPNCTPDIIQRCAESAAMYGSGIAAIPVADTVKTADGGIITATLDRSKLYAAQTPQAFNFNLIYDAYALAGNEASKLTDDAAVFEKFGGKGVKIRLVESSPDNYKVTTMDDIKRFNAERTPSSLRIGLGSDTHRLVPNRKLTLGGVTIPHDLGLLGHSDADALVHSVIDALLSAAGLRDIGFYFPDTDPAYKDADSICLLKKVAEMLKEITVVNISSVIHAQKPKMNPFIPEMCGNIAAALNIGKDRVSISAKTGEGIGIIGEEKVIICETVCLVSLTK